jgi:hypothetical protein
MENEARKPKKMTEDELDSILYPSSNYLKKEFVDQRRWTTTFRYVFLAPDGLWAVNVERGSTELQEVDQPEEYECYPVKAVPSVTYERE